MILNDFCDENLWINGTIYAENPDFSFCFQNTILVWLPCFVLWSVTPIWIYMLTRLEKPKINISLITVLKMISTCLLLIIEVLNIYSALIEKKEFKVFYVSPVVLILSYILASILINYERAKGLETSTLLFTFWSFLLLTACIRFRSIVIYMKEYTKHDAGNKSFSLITFGIFLTALLSNTILSMFSIGERKKHKLQDNELKDYPEDNVSILSKLWFWWMNSLIVTGYKRDLTRQDLWNINEKESSNHVTNEFEKYWNKQANDYIEQRLKSENYKQIDRSYLKNENNSIEEKIKLNNTQDTKYDMSNKKLKKPSFGFALIKVFRGKFLAGSLLKIIYDLFQFVGPLILDKLIQFIKDKNQNIIVGIFLSSLLFLSSLIQSLVLQHYFHRMIIVGARLRTSIMNVVYKKSLKLSASARKQATVGEMTNILSVNAQTVCDLVTYLNIVWSSPLQITIAIYFLYQYLGISALIGVATMIVFIPINILLANKTKIIQRKKLKLQDSRIKMMNEIISGIKVIKFYGWELSFQKIIQDIRSNELVKLRNIGLLNVTSSLIWSCAPLIVTITSFTAFILLDEENILDASTAFVSLSLFNILRFPMSVFPHIISSMINANVSLKRIREFLLLDEINSTDVTFNNIEGVAVKVENVDLGFDTKDTYFKDLNLEIKQGELVAVVGMVGSGKSSLLSGFLGEMHKLNNGLLNLNGSTAYVSQQAWIQNATIRENILFGRKYNEDTYNEIIKACCLNSDFKIMPANDLTEIGEKGINLSGGQKQRISLARSLYADSDIYFLDDPLSAVDSHVGKDLFDQVIGPKGVLTSKTRILVTNALSFLPQVDKILMMQNGNIVEIGSYEELNKDKSGQFSEFIKNFLINELSETNEVELNIIQNEQDNKKEQIDDIKSKEQNSVKLKAGEKIIVKENIESGKVKKAIFSTYFKACSFGFSILSVILFGFLYIAQAASNIWLSDWSNDTKDNDNNNYTKEYRLTIFVILGLIQCFISFFSESFYLFTLLNGAKVLHNKMLESILRSTMEFFESTPSGRIINRFSKDVDATEQIIPVSFKGLISCIFSITTTLLIIIATTPLFSIPLIPIVIVYIIILKYFVASMRQLKRLESASKSPIFSHFTESLTGVGTIRAFKEEKRFIKKMENHIDENLLYYFPNNMANRWLAIRLEFIGNLMTASAAFFAVVSRDSISAGSAALSITYALNITQTLNWLVRMSAEFETNITSAERIDEYCNIPHESEWISKTCKPSDDWPQLGKIVFDDYSVKYRQELENVLKNICVHIEAGEKIGIVGRTGAGKSSLSLGLFRLLEYSTGRILIDDVDIKSIGLHELRQKLTIIPQDPVLFSGSLRVNIDPFKSYSDDKLWNTLELAHLKQFVSSLEKGLDFECSEGGDNLSVGQRQLICLTRALLRKTKILVLDEATASVDHNTDDLIQNTIRQQFKDCTILTIAHRLNTILDSSRIMVLDKGSIAEFNTPKSLLEDRNSIFYSMAKDAAII